MPISDRFRDLLLGRFSRRAMLCFLTMTTLIFWGLILLAWLLYPRENSHSIMTHTFSFLGSFDDKHNPRWWWIFSIAMIFWGAVAVPLTLYIHRRFAALSTWGAHVGAVLLFIGCINIALVGVFPDARGVVFGVARLGEVHKWVAILAGAGFILGIGWHGALLLIDWVCARLRQRPCIVAHRRLLPPYLFWSVMLSVAAWFLIAWEIRYAEMKAAAERAGTTIGSSWSEALNTRYSFPLWENICIYVLFVFLVWFSAVLAASDGTRY